MTSKDGTGDRIARVFRVPLAALLGRPTINLGGREVEVVPPLAAFLDAHPEIPGP